MSTITLPERGLDEPSTPDAPRSPARGVAWRLLRGREADAAWVRPSLIGLLAVTAVLYLWGLGASGWANSFYSAAVQAGTKSWKAFFFGSSDAASSITVDKPPASLWVMGVSARIFGLSSWSILVPQALEGVAAVGFLYATVRRWFTPAAGLLAGAILALTPVAALMFRFNNPDALLVLLLVVGAYALVRAVESGRTGWLVAASALVGMGFLTKMLQALLVVPAFGLVYLVAGPTPLRRRIGQLLTAAVALVASAGWWVAIVELWPASSRPYIGGSQTNSVLDLIFGYNGLGRLTGNETGSVGGGGQGTGQWGPTGWLRMFNAEFGSQVSWLLPAALLLLVAGLVLTLRRPRTDRTRAALLLWGGWLVVTLVVLSLSRGIIHPYYTVALAPAVAAVLAIGGRALWVRRSTWLGRVGTAVLVISAGAWSYVLLARNASWHPELRYAILALAIAAGLALLVPSRRLGRTATAVVLSAGLVAGLAGPAAYTVATATTAHSGSIPTAGPSGAGSATGGPTGGRPGGQGGQAPSGAPGAPPSAATGSTGSTTGTASIGSASMGTSGMPSGGQGGGTATSSELTALLKATTTTWAAATSGAQSAASLELATGQSVIGIGGFTGSDPAPTLAQFTAWVAQGKISYYIAGGNGGAGAGGPGGSSGSAAEISSWVAANYSSTTVGSTTVYDLRTTSS